MCPPGQPPRDDQIMATLRGALALRLREMADELADDLAADVLVALLAPELVTPVKVPRP